MANRRPPVLIAHAVVAQLAASVPRSSVRRSSPADEYRYRPEAFLEDVLSVRLFSGFSLDWARDAATGWLHGHARERYNRTGRDPLEFCRAVRPDLPPWSPGEPVVNTIVLQGGAGLGKSVVVAALLLWAGYVSRSFTGAVYAPFVDQAYRATWRYLDAYMTGAWAGCRSDLFASLLARRKGREGDPAIEAGPLWSISTKAVNQGTTRVQGGHAIVDPREDRVSASVHVFEEADGIDDPSVFDAVRTMTDKGVSLWLLCLNPATPTAPVQSLHGPKVKRYEISVLDSPNVVEGRDVVPGASNREWVESKLGDDDSAWARPVPEHDARRGTFELPWLPGRIFEPRPPWWWRVLGKVPPTGGSDSVVPEALYLSACSRDWRKIFEASDPSFCSVGVDVAQSDAGRGDSGSIWLRWRGVLRRVARPQQKDTRVYGRILIELLQSVADQAPKEKRSPLYLSAGVAAVDLEVRIDNGGGFGRDVYNQIVDAAVWDRFRSSRVVLCDFGGKPTDGRRYKNWVTEAYHAVAEALRTHALADPPPELRLDLCGRKERWETVAVGASRVDVVGLEPKKAFRERVGRSPDDGDAVALACYPRTVADVSGFAAYDGRRWGGDGSDRGEGARQEEDPLLGRTPWDDRGEWDEDDGDRGGGALEGMRWRR